MLNILSFNSKPTKSFNKREIEQRYKNEFSGLYLTRKNVKEMFGEYEDRKVSIWEELDRKFNQKQIIEEDIKKISQMRSFDIRQHDIVLSPSVFRPSILNPRIMNFKQKLGTSEIGEKCQKRQMPLELLVEIIKAATYPNAILDLKTLKQLET
uniref:Uncharacterized protein n=1 Tax=Meloidogyne javanica TaxID=6303 RepID=A0A915MIK8_MELJA